MGITVDQDLIQLFHSISAKADDNTPERALLVRGERHGTGFAANIQLKLVSTYDTQGKSDQEEFRPTLSHLLLETDGGGKTQPAEVLYRLDSRGAAGLWEWICVLYQPDDAPIKEKMAYGNTRTSFVQAIGERDLLDIQAPGSFSDVSFPLKLRNARKHDYQMPQVSTAGKAAAVAAGTGTGGARRNFKPVGAAGPLPPRPSPKPSLNSPPSALVAAKEEAESEPVKEEAEPAKEEAEPVKEEAEPAKEINSERTEPPKGEEPTKEEEEPIAEPATAEAEPKEAEVPLAKEVPREPEATPTAPAASGTGGPSEATGLDQVEEELEHLSDSSPKVEKFTSAVPQEQADETAAGAEVEPTVEPTVEQEESKQEAEQPETEAQISLAELNLEQKPTEAQLEPVDQEEPKQTEQEEPKELEPQEEEPKGEESKEEEPKEEEPKEVEPEEPKEEQLEFTPESSSPTKVVPLPVFGAPRPASPKKPILEEKSDDLPAAPVPKSPQPPAVFGAPKLPSPKKSGSDFGGHQRSTIAVGQGQGDNIEDEEEVVRRAEAKERADQTAQAAASHTPGIASLGIGVNLHNDASVAVRALRTNVRTNTVILSLHGEELGLASEPEHLTPEQIQAKLSVPEPRLAFYRYGDSTEPGAYLYIYSCPTGTPVRQRMLYSVSVMPLLAAARESSQLGLVNVKKVEVTDIEDLTPDVLAEAAATLRPATSAASSETPVVAGEEEEDGIDAIDEQDLGGAGTLAPSVSTRPKRPGRH